MPNHSFSTEMIVRTLGRADKQVSLSIVSCPPIDADIIFKTHAFDNVIRQIEPYVDKFEYAELSSFLMANIPGTSTAANEQATECGRRIRECLFTVKNIEQVVSFQNSKGEWLAVDNVIKPAAVRPKDISWVSIEFRFDVSSLLLQEITPDDDPHSNVFVGTFTFGLPQSQLKADGTPVRRQLFGNQDESEAVKAKKDISDFTALEIEGSYDLSQVGLENGTDTLKDYTQAVLDLLDVDQTFYLWSRSKANQDKAELKIPKSLARALVVGPVGNTDGSFSSCTFTGSFEFLEHQESFDMMFPKPVKPRENMNDASYERFEKFVDQKQYVILQTLMRIDYVGSNARMDHKMTQDLVSRIRSIKLDPTGKAGLPTADRVFHAMLTWALCLLPETVEMWHCSLPEVFLQVFPDNIRSAIECDNSLSDTLSATKLLTKFEQLGALRK
jgi:hypothetical protein